MTASIRTKASETYSKNAQEFLKKAKFDEAVLDLNKATFLDSKNHKAWYELGKIHREFHEYQKSSQAFRQASRIKPKNAIYLMAFTESALKAGEDEQLSGYLEKVPDSKLASTLQWLICTKNLEPKNCADFAQKTKNPNYFLALNYLLEKNYTQFYKILPKIKAQTPDFACPEQCEWVIWQLEPDREALQTLAVLKIKLENSQISESQELFTCQALDELGFSLLTLGPSEKLAQKYPKYRDAWLVAGEASFLEEDYEAALEKLEIAEKLDYNYLPTLKVLAKTYAALDQADQDSDYNSRIEKLSD